MESLDLIKQETLEFKTGRNRLLVLIKVDKNDKPKGFTTI